MGDHTLTWTKCSRSAWGFIASQEVKDAGVTNLGSRDQRLALQWIQKYISKFGGDPHKVTIWGESAGALSVGVQMVAYNGDNHDLFRAAFMQSGRWVSPTRSMCTFIHRTQARRPLGMFCTVRHHITLSNSLAESPLGQKYYDALVNATSCSKRSDTLQCLREVPYDELKKAVNQVRSIMFQSRVHYEWLMLHRARTYSRIK